MTRETQIEQFLSSTDWLQASRTPLNQDASFRRYWRLQKQTAHAMLMDAPPPEKPVSLFADIARFLLEHGLSAPQIYALDAASGLMLLQDLGDDTFTRILAADPKSEAELYQLAIDTLVRLHSIPEGKLLSLPAYDHSTLLSEARLFIEWFYPAVSGRTASAEQIQQFDAAWQSCFDALTPHRSVLVLRDYHVDNLMRLNSGDHIHCGLLDFQDALIGSPAYDLVSLLEDARRDIPPPLRQRCLTRYNNAMRISGVDAPDATALQPWINVLGAQRHAKVLGIFVRLCKRDQKPHYLIHLPRVTALLQDAIEREPGLTPVADWMRVNLPFESIDLRSITP